MAKTSSRGRRAEKKSSKEEKVGSNEEFESGFPENTANDDSVQAPEAKTPFFGLVDANELDYFKQTESTLNINAFETPEEREGFIRSVLEEAKGKELKLVTNQICSKLMERLVLFSSDRQLKNIFHSFLNHFNSLSYHKYASHVLETLLVRSARLIEKELIGEQVEDEEGEEESEDVQITMETLFIKMLNEIKPSLKTMINHQYASHVLRIILLIIAGRELPSSTISNSTLRSKKSKIARKMIEIKDNDDFNKSYQIPGSFKDELREICQIIAQGQDIKSMRQLSIDKIASPVVQLLLQVEGLIDKERNIWHLIFLKHSDPKEEKEGAFVEHLLSDPVGSHFLEAIIKNQGVRGQYIERLYALYMKDRVLKLCKRSTTGVFIIQALVFKLKPKEVEHILDEVIPELSNLVNISENQNLDLGQKMIDGSISRGNYRRDELIEQLFKKFAPNYNPSKPANDTSTEFLENVLQLTGSTLGNKRDDWPTAEERRRSLFLEKLMEYDGKFRICVWLNFMALPVERLIQMCLHGVFSHVVEKSLELVIEEDGQEAKSNLILRKRLLNQFQNEIVGLACNSYGSHIVDKLWNFTVFLPMYKDRIGSELLKESHKVKESTYGRLVWKNWSMELFTRKKFDWKALVKQQEKEFYGEADDAETSIRAKKPIELKMEKLLEEKKLKEERAQSAEQGYLKRKLEQDLGETHEKKTKLRGRRR